MREKTDEKTDCKHIQSMIPDYLDEKLDMVHARLFTGHIQNCAACRDELEISYLLKYGLQRVEDGESINLRKDLDKMLVETEDTMTRLSQFGTAVNLIEATAVFMLCACVLILYL